MTSVVSNRSFSLLAHEKIEPSPCYLVLIDDVPETIELSSIEKLWEEAKASDYSDEVCRHLRRLHHVISHFIRDEYCRNDPACRAFASLIHKELHLVKKSSIAVLDAIKYQLYAHFGAYTELKTFMSSLSLKKRLKLLTEHILKDPWHKDEELFLQQELTALEAVSAKVTVVQHLFNSIVKVRDFTKSKDEALLSTKRKVVEVVKVKKTKLKALSRVQKQWKKLIASQKLLIEAPAADVDSQRKAKFADAMLINVFLGTELERLMADTSKSSCDVYVAIDDSKNICCISIAEIDSSQSTMKVHLLVSHPDNLQVLYPQVVKGSGTAIIKTLVERARARECSLLRLGSTGSACKWYERLGFTQVSESKLAEELIKYGGEVDPAPQYELDSMGMDTLLKSLKGE